MTREEAKRILYVYRAVNLVDASHREAFDMAIEALSSSENPNKWIGAEVLDKIRAEIERKAHSGQWSDATMYGMLKAVAIIDKYKAESEVDS